MIRTVLAGTLSLVVIAGSAYGQAAPAAAPGPTQVKVTVVLTRYDGEKKVSSMPNELLIQVLDNPDPASQFEASLAFGVQVPVNIVANNTNTVAYKDVGNRISCRLTPQAEGRYRLRLTVVQSSVDSPKAAADPSKPGPILRSFDSSYTMVLRDGQTMQSTSAVDPVSGEVLKVTVTLNVVK
jgi:hypothetical protein